MSFNYLTYSDFIACDIIISLSHNDYNTMHVLIQPQLYSLSKSLLCTHIHFKIVEKNKVWRTP